MQHLSEVVLMHHSPKLAALMKASLVCMPVRSLCLKLLNAVYPGITLLALLACQTCWPWSSSALLFARVCTMQEGSFECSNISSTRTRSCKGHPALFDWLHKLCRTLLIHDSLQQLRQYVSDCSASYLLILKK